MTTPTNQPSETPELNECLKALHCLYISVDASVAKSVNDKVGAYIDQLTQQLAEANEKCDGFKLYYEQLGAICDSDKLAIMSLQQQLATALEANKNANALIGATTEECKTVALKLEEQLAVAVAERDELIFMTSKCCICGEKPYRMYPVCKKHMADNPHLKHFDEVKQYNQSLTTLCAELVEALELLNRARGGTYQNMEIYDKVTKALAHYAELLKK